MKAIRIATLVAALCVGMTTVAAAQSTEPQQGQGEGRRGGVGGWLLTDITLSDAQKAQVTTIRDTYVTQPMELRKQAQAVGGAPDEATRTKMMDLQTKQAAEIRAVLTADQQAQFDKNLAAVKERMAARKNGSS